MKHPILLSLLASLTLAGGINESALNLTPKQKEQMKQYKDEMKACKQKHELKILSILDDEQKLKYLSMKKQRKEMKEAFMKEQRMKEVKKKFSNKGLRIEKSQDPNAPVKIETH